MKLIFYFFLFSFNLICLSLKINKINKNFNFLFSWIENENEKVLKTNEKIINYLILKKIPLNKEIKERNNLLKENNNNKKKNEEEEENKQKLPEIVKSNQFKSYFCRLSLSNSNLNDILISPCGCIGSQKWVQVSEINRMRRLYPENWNYCRTCQQPFNYQPFYQYSNLKTALLSYILDRRWLLRSIIFTITSLMLSLLPLNKYYHMLLTSTFFWQMYPQWQFIYRLPLLFQFWFLQTIFSFLSLGYLSLEKVLIGSLADLESKLISLTLPIQQDEDHNHEHALDEDEKNK